jgi:beta-xylosidase
MCLHVGMLMLCRCNPCAHTLYYKQAAASNGGQTDDARDSNSTDEISSNDNDDSDWLAYKILNETTTRISIPLCQRLKTFKLQGDAVSIQRTYTPC